MSRPRATSIPPCNNSSPTVSIPKSGKLGQPLRVFSPLSGQVVEMASAHGEYRNDVTAPLMTVADLSTVWLTASVQEKDLRFLAKGQEINASFAAYPGEKITGTILFIGDLVDPDIRVTKVRIAFANPQHRLKPGMFATVNFLGFPARKSPCHPRPSCKAANQLLCLSKSDRGFYGRAK